jgi:general L-amino acid transport system permease protein
MSAPTFQAIPPRPAPTNTEGVLAWLRANLFGDWKTASSTLILGGLLLWFVPQFLNWSLFSAVWAPDLKACRAAEGIGACWGVVAEKYRLIIFGRYPFEQQWRPLVATLLMLLMLVASCMPQLFAMTLQAVLQEMLQIQ